MKKNTTKRMLFEMMEKVNPEFEKPINESRMPRERLMAALKQKFKLNHIDTSEKFYSEDSGNSGIWLSGENGETATDGRPLFDYYSIDHKNYTFGVHNEFQNFCEQNGWYPEWNDPGTLMIWED